jgi:hypothetical protein
LYESALLNGCGFVFCLNSVSLLCSFLLSCLQRRFGRGKRGWRGERVGEREDGGGGKDRDCRVGGSEAAVSQEGSVKSRHVCVGGREVAERGRD